MTGQTRLLLAAEDSEAHRLVLSRIMEEVRGADGVGVDLRFVGNGIELLAYLASEHLDRPRPDLIMLDLHMPSMGGMEALQRLRRDEQLRAIPVVIMSSADTPSNIDEAYASGANAFLVKHGSHAILLEQMRAFSAFWLETARLPGRRAD